MLRHETLRTLVISTWRRLWVSETGTLDWTNCVGFKFCRFQSQTGTSEVLRAGIEVEVWSSQQKASGSGTALKT